MEQEVETSSEESGEGADPSRRRSTIHAIRPESVRRAPFGEAGMLLGAKYRLDRRIATGGMASVWIATHTTLRRPVAVKFLDGARVASDHEHVSRFLREAQVAASVRHKNVVDIVDFGIHEHAEGREPYMIMELLEGEALDQRLSRGMLPVDQAIRVARDVLSGLEAVHAAGIVHSDLKPANVFVTEDEDGLFARVIDFGISQETDDTARERVVIGTPEYMSPEQAFAEPLDARSDLYSVGVVLFEMLAGFPPIEDPDPFKVVQRVAYETPPPLTSARPELVDVSRVIERAMARRREDRFPSARAMARALADLSNDPDVSRRISLAPVDAAVRARREAPTHDALPAPSPITQSVPPPQPSNTPMKIALAVVTLALVGVLLWIWRGRETAVPSPVASRVEIAAPSEPVHSDPVVPPASAAAAAPSEPAPSEPAPAATVEEATVEEATVEEATVEEAAEPTTATAPTTADAPSTERAEHTHHHHHGAAPASEAPAGSGSGITRDLDF